MEFDAFGTHIETNPDGSLLAKTASGTAISLDAEGNASINLERIKSVGLKNIIDVEAHNINTVAGSRSHYVRFLGGGEVQFAYNHKGQLIELSSTKVAISITRENELIFSRLIEEDKKIAP